MISTELENLVRSGALKKESSDAGEINGLIKSGAARLDDAANKTLSIESRFDLAYNGAHALALAALRRRGYRAANRYIVFQALQHTLGMSPGTWRVLDKAHQMRNAIEYEGAAEIDERLLADILQAASTLRATLLDQNA